MSTGQRLGISLAQLEAVARLFAALSESSRLVLLQALHGGPLTVSQLVKACAMKQANVSKHLRVLHDHRLVRRHREGIWVHYEITDPMVFALCNLVCGAMERSTACAAALFHPEPPAFKRPVSGSASPRQTALPRRKALTSRAKTPA